MTPGKHYQRKPVAPHQFHEHECGSIVPSLGGGNSDEIIGLHGLTVLFLQGLDAERKSCSGEACDQE